MNLEVQVRVTDGNEGTLITLGSQFLTPEGIELVSQTWERRKANRIANEKELEAKKANGTNTYMLKKG